MDAIGFLKKEHQTAKAALARVLQASPQERGRLWKELKPELEVHEQMEEACVYGPVSQLAGSKDQTLAQWNQHHHDEVSKVERLMREIDTLKPEDESWRGKVAEVQSKLQHHIMEEEQQIFPRIATVWDANRLEQATSQMKEMKSRKLQHA